MLTLSEQNERFCESIDQSIESAPVRLLVAKAAVCSLPVTVAVPVPAGLWSDADCFEVQDPPSGWKAPCQIEWSQGREWLHAMFLAPPGLEGHGEVLLQPTTQTSEEPMGIRRDACATSIQAGELTLLFNNESDRLLDQITSEHGAFLHQGGMRLEVSQAEGKRRPVRWLAAHVDEVGPLRTTVRREGNALGMRVTCRLSCYAGMSYVRCELTLHNPRRAKHPEGFWDLGDPGSMLFREVALHAELALEEPIALQWQAQPDAAVEKVAGSTFSLHQESSGGEHWQSPNHVNRQGEVPLRFRGYRVTTASGEQSGWRVSPVVSIRDDHRSVACAVEEFWQKFPTAIEVADNRLNIKLWPGECADLHELQAGECCTRVIWLDFSSAAASPTRLAWVYDPPTAIADPRDTADSGRVPYLPAPAIHLRPEYRQILDEALEGPRNFFEKRETIDDYSWRNFGDMWADHEEAYADDPRPVISHYNNQYDLLHGLLIQYLRTGDRRWWQLADPLARHVMDIDVYRTDRDKPAYNNGLFWHTAHYHAVGRATHRSMSSVMRGKRIPAPGTGPGNEHNYSSGLLLYHQLTGCPRARETVIGLADWVIAMDDGRRHMLGLFSSQPTGLATCTTDPEYHGPGRGAANSIQTLLNAWKLTADNKYLDYASALIRRTIHPHDDIAARRLDNAELRWSYTVYLQALDRYLLETAGRSDVSQMRAYVRQSLLHYARWIVEHEKFYLDEPEKLEYPTETWAAQELRKGTTLLMAARYASPGEAMEWRCRADEILDRAWQSLMSFETRTCTRPLALVLQQGHLETSLRDAEPIDDGARQEFDFGTPTPFQTQKQQIKSLRRSPARLLGTMAQAANPGRWLHVASQLWLTERIRRCLD